MNAHSNQEEVKSPANKIWDYAVGVLFVLSFVAFYTLKASVVVKWLVFLVILASSLGVFFFVSPVGLSLKGYFKDSWNELKKVVWPTRKEALQFTWVVFLFVVIIGLFLWLADSVFSWVLYDLVFKRV